MAEQLDNRVENGFTTLFTLIIIFVVVMAAINHKSQEHHCKDGEMCIYDGINYNERRIEIAKVCGIETDSYFLDMAHFDHPEIPIDKLEDIIWGSKQHVKH